MKRNAVDLIVRDAKGKLILWATREHSAKTVRGLDRVHKRLSWELLRQYPSAASVTVRTI